MGLQLKLVVLKIKKCVVLEVIIEIRYHHRAKMQEKQHGSEATTISGEGAALSLNGSYNGDAAAEMATLGPSFSPNSLK